MTASAIPGFHLSSQRGLPFNVAQLFMRMTEGIREGKPVSTDFDVAVKRHELLDAILVCSK
jgi:hypothetical protein